MNNEGKDSIRSMIRGKIALLGELGGIKGGVMSDILVRDVGDGYELCFKRPGALALFELDILIRRNCLN